MTQQLTIFDKITALMSYDEISDVHIREGEPLWVRNAGDLTLADDVIVSAQDIQLLLSQIVPEGFEIKANLTVKGDLDFATNISNVRMRCNLYLVGGGMMGLSMRRLRDKLPHLDDLNLPLTVKSLIDKAKGLFLVTGATGSGKSTTLAGIIQYLNHSFPGHIVTVEDPIEYKFTSGSCKITQREIGRDALDFPAALRSALRQDPDIIMIGEMRDKETVQTALDAAETGHLVLATLHTMNAKQSVERITSFFNGSEKEWVQAVLASVLNGILSQVLIKKTEGGRTLAYELMVNTPATKQCIKEGKVAQISNVMETGSKEGQVLMNQILAEKVRSGEITVEDAIYFSYDSVNLQKDLADGY